MNHEDFMEKIVGIVMAIVFIAIEIVGLICATFVGIWMVRNIMEML